MATFTSSHEPVLGTRLLLRLTTDDEPAATAAEAEVMAVFDRLEAMLSAHRVGSEWNRWRRGEVAEAGPEISELLCLAAHWRRVTRGAFDPQAGVLRERWLAAERDQRIPSDGELGALAAAVRRLPYALTDHGVERIGDCSRLDLHALAKGWIVDRAAAAAMAVPGIEAVVVNAGGDLVHRGTGEVLVGVEDPRRPFDNVPPLARMHFRNGGLATGSGAHRPLRIGGRRLSHVIDPRTGATVDHILSASVMAPDCATADALATAVGVLPVDEGLTLADATDGAACLLLTATGELRCSERWAACTA